MKKFKYVNSPISRIIIMTAAGCLLIFCTRCYIPVKAVTVPTVHSVYTGVPYDTPLTHINDRRITLFNDLSKKINKFRNEHRNDLEDEAYSPSVLSYNLARLFPTELSEISMENKSIYTLLNNPSELTDIILKPLYQQLNISMKNRVKDSYGGQMYEFLNKKDAEWTSGLYKWIQASPAQAAQMKSHSLSSVTGDYNPSDEKHKADDPSTWLIPSWKNVTIHFTDGNGKPIDLYSNTQEILAMASVNTYFSNWQDTGFFKSYIDYLWNASHSYSTSIGNVYHCDGCETLPDETETLEQADNEVIANEANIPLDGEKKTSETAQSASQPQSKAVNETEISKTADSSNGTDVPSVIKAEEGPASALPIETVPALSPATDFVANTAGTPAATSPGTPSTGEVPIMANNQPNTGIAPGAEIKNITEETKEQEKLADNISSNTLVGTSDDTITTASESVSATHIDTQNDLNMENAVQTAEIVLNADGKFCPGHVDLTINAYILGLTGTKNLFGADKASSQEWTSYRRAYVNQLNGQDWNLEYGLSSMQLGIGKPLTANEVRQYMELLPEELSSERRAVIAYALNSVGKIPYYYGGKPSASGYENNNFSSPTKPDQNGRVLSGLDCSGWVNWVYWSAVNKRLSGLGTSGLIYEGQGISRSELKPGDILVKPGLNSHVVMFLGWAPNGNIICIHETGSSTNNVTVSTLTANFPYYRSILD